jgi:hypothetical protein
MSKLVGWILAICAVLSLQSGEASVEQAHPSISAGILLQTSLVAGLAHHEARQVWPEIRPGDALELSREADNAQDRNAVQVRWRKHLLGYLPRADNEDVARMIDRGQALEARVRTVTKYRNHRRKLEVDVFLRF